MEPIIESIVSAAPAAKTPLRSVAHDKWSTRKNPRYFVWYAFLADPANKQASAPKKLTLYCHIDYGIESIDVPNDERWICEFYKLVE
nr:hypothetical protein Iba_scaffold62211CG0010 [Ipomoea batatas]GMD63243.1 hypothetical protein Iba_chr12bCG12980 [Ipomoea batatas]GME00660.1 hypothetical protein Iba_contig62CG0020 [Ipomoea batatas]